MSTDNYEKDGTDLADSNWEVLLLSTLARCREQLPAAEQGSLNNKASLAFDVDEILELAWQRGHAWVPRPERAK